MKHLLLPISLTLVALAGCTVGPNYKRPQMALPGEFRGAPAAGAATASLADTKWQDLFNDPALNQIVTAALEKNFDLRIAAERIEQAHAQLGIVRANQYPFLDVQTGFTGSRPSTAGANAFVPTGTNLSAAYTTLGAAL